MRRLRRPFAAALAAFACVLGAGPTAAVAAWVWPVSGEVITPYRNGSDPYATGQHRGIDLAAPIGTPVRAAAAGDVRFAGTAGSSGVTISIRTSDGYDTSYLHLSALDVRAGAHVSAGERIGAVGTTGTRSAASPHLHFGVRDAGTRHAYHDPLAFLPPAPPASPAPEPPAPVPAPRPEPSPPPPAPVPLPAGAPRIAPIPRAVPRPSDAPFPHRAPLPTAAPAPRPAPLLSRRPLRLPRSSPHPAVSPSPRLPPIPKDASGNSQDISSDRAPQQLRTPSVSAEPAAGGAGIGWVLACAGLLLAAAVLGLSEDGRRATGRTRSKLIAALTARG